MSSDQYLNLKEAAKYLGVSDTKMRRLIDKGLLHVSADPLDDRKRLVEKSDLDALKKPRPVEGKSVQHPAPVPQSTDQKKYPEADPKNIFDES